MTNDLQRSCNGHKSDPASGLKRFLIQYAPDFCWMTSNDLFLMAELVFEELYPTTFRVTLSKMKRDGYFTTKPYDGFFRVKTGPTPNLYLRTSKGE